MTLIKSYSSSVRVQNYKQKDNLIRTLNYDNRKKTRAQVIKNSKKKNWFVFFLHVFLLCN